jgi:SPP1 family predicted phage head-tail adaptor
MATRSNPARPYLVDPGELRDQIQIQQQTTAQDDFGQPQSTWTTVLTAMSKIASITMAERFQTAQFVAQISHRITLRWPGAGVTIQGGMRVMFGTRIFQLQEVDNVEERNVTLHLLCLEINGAGSA